MKRLAGWVGGVACWGVLSIYDPTLVQTGMVSYI